MDNSELIRQNIKKIREQKNLTQAEVAELVGLSVTGYAKIERGETGLDAKRLYQIAQVLEVGLWDLVPNTANDGAVVFHNNENFSNFNVAVGNPALEAEIAQLRTTLDFKDNLLEAREREIESLKSQIVTLQKLVAALEKN